MSHGLGTTKYGNAVNLTEDLGNTVLTVRKDANTSDADNGEYGPLYTDSTGSLKVNATNTVTIQGIQDSTTTGTITSPTSIIGPLNINQRNVVTINVFGTYAGVTFVAEVSPDNTNWFSVQMVDIATSRTQLYWNITDNSNAAYECAVGANSYIRIRATTWVSGTANIAITAQSFAYEPIPTAMVQPIEVDYTMTTVTAVNNDCFSIDTTGVKSIMMQFTAVGGTCTFQGSNDGVTWSTINAINASSGAVATTTTAVGIFAISVKTRYVRARVTTYSATWNGKFRTSSQNIDNVGSTQAVSGTVGVTGLPTAAAAADAYANPTVTHMGSEVMNFNGTSWDRVRNNITVTMGDTGAKTATFNGATQTNYNARGAYITVAVSAAAGTTPTLSAQLQVSYDGTNFLNLGPASGTLTAAGQIMIAVYPTNHSVAGATPANLTSGATQTVTINAPLPRTWRLVYTITGTTPSFTFTNAYAAYIN